MYWAYVRDGQVQWTAEIDEPSTAYGKGVRENMVECSSEVEKGWHYDGTTFTPPTAEEKAAKEAADQREARTTALLDQFDKLLDKLEVNGVITQADVDEVRSAGVETE